MCIRDSYSIETTSLSAGLVGQAHYQNKQVYAWTANSERSIQKILRSRADGLVTDNIPLAKYEAGEMCIRDRYRSSAHPKTII